MDGKPASKTGLARIIAAAGYSAAGLKAAWRHEAAFRQELILAVPLLAVLYFLPLSLPFKGLLAGATILLLIVELLNSALEALADLASPGYHPLAKRAKDLGSAAVLLSLLLALGAWIIAIAQLIGDY